MRREAHTVCGDGAGTSSPAWSRAARAPPARARSRADRPQPGASARLRPPRRDAVLRRRVLPDLARGREGRGRLDAGARRVAFRQGPHGRARRTPACSPRTGSPVARPAPRVRIELSPRLWLGSFLVTSLIYLVQIDAEGISAGRWPLLAPWLHTAALPVFAVLSVVVALVYRAVENWLSDYESYARDTAARASRLLSAETLSAPRTSRRRARHAAQPLRARVRSQASSRACVGLRHFASAGLGLDLDHGRRTS